MKDMNFELVDVSQLKVGMYVELELGWMAHPFPTSSFKISSEKQIETIRGLGLKRVKFVPPKSDPQFDTSSEAAAAAAAAAQAGDAVTAAREAAAAAERNRKKLLADQLGAQNRSLALCERRFGEAIRQYKQAIEQVAGKPREAAEQCLALVNGFVNEMLADGESAIRLLSEGMGDRASMHPVNVTVVSLLLGKALNLPQPDMVDLGMAAFLHDIGKTQLPDRVRWLEENFSTAEYKLYQEHVSQGVMLAKRMELTPGAMLALAQHHEMIDGSGFPGKLKGDKMGMPAKILALINRYENLCNPSRPAAAMTPHEALSLIFAQLKTRFDGVALGAFIRMMGVYPPGSVVQLVDERYAIVVSVNSARPLKPRVVVHDPAVAKHEALILDLETTPNVGIRRSVKPAALPRDSLDYLAPRQRIGYFFEKANPPLAEATP
jgi:HD-GYP domain-containing protein (c-di-GMP phosphodiesterase class II)